MSFISKICIATTMMLSMFSCNAQIKNANTVNAKIYGNCGMCEKTIEKAGNASGVAKVDWDKDTKMATLTYDSSRTNQDEILNVQNQNPSSVSNEFDNNSLDLISFGKNEIILKRYIAFQ